MNKQMMLIVVCLLGAGFFAMDALHAQEFSDLPPAVQKTVRDALGRASVSKIELDTDDGKLFYEIDAETADGREIDLDVAEDGTLLKKVEEISLANVPAAVGATIERELGGVRPEQVEQVTEEGIVHYKVEAKVPGADIELEVGEDGRLLDKEVDQDDDDGWAYPAWDFPVGDVDVSEAKIVILNPKSRIQVSAADMLRDEIEKRTRIGLEVVTLPPPGGVPAIVIGVGREVTGEYPLPVGLRLPQEADGYALWIDAEKRRAATVCLAGVDNRGALFAAGRLLRVLKMSRDRVGIDEGIRIATAPAYSLRGHQLGYRPKTNSYDGWTVAMWEQYYRDMVVFGMNALELIPPRSDDDDDSPHFPLAQMEMMVEMSQLADDYGLDVWIWYPAIDDDYSDPVTVEFALKEREEVFRKLPRIDALFVPGGDPGDTHPKILLPFMERQKRLLNRYHPKAQIWVSPQGFDRKGKNRDGWLRVFFDILQKEKPMWLDGVVFGPQVETSLANLRQEVPGRYAIRRYPDITHSRSCQYAVPNWDSAYRSTLGREPINPRPRAYTKIFRDLQQYSVGFITYSEGCNDDVNKIVWSCLGWDPDMKVEDILKEYSRYFISPRYEQEFARGLSGLEQNWEGPTLTNESVYETLRIFQEMEEDALPQDKLNWRFQQGLYRAYYDAYIKHRLLYETKLWQQAMDLLKSAEQNGSAEMLEEAQRVLDKAVTEPVATDLRARVFELAEALFQSIRMQLSVPKYQAIRVNRGANLDEIDKPLIPTRELKSRLMKIEKRESLKSGRGLVGTYFNSADFDEPEEGMIDILTSLDNNWGKNRGEDWSASWKGFIEGPFTGDVTFTAEVNDGIRLKISDKMVIDGLSGHETRTGKVEMVKGKKEPVVIEFTSMRSKARLRVYWEWQGCDKTVVPAAALSHDVSKLWKDYKLFDFDQRPSQQRSEDKDLDFLPRFTGGSPPYADTSYHDGRFRPAVGVHNFEVIRSNRTHPELVTDDIPSYPDGGFENVGFTYNHAPMLCYWQDKFWLLYRSGPVHEHQEPCYALITWSQDGRRWHKPQTIFPAKKFRNKKRNDREQYSISHQRMGWYIAPDGRLIVCGFYGMPTTPNDGKGVGRVVRQVKGPGDYGPIYWVRYNKYQGYGPGNSPHFPYYKESPDKGFVKAVDELLADKLMVQQWYEEDRDNENSFFAFVQDRARYAKAFDWYYLPEGRIVGMWKWRRMAIADRWEPGHISEQGKGRDIYYGGAKIWGQRTADGRYALVYNPVKDTRWRHPLAVITGDDGLNFDRYFLNVHADTPPMRFGGANKDGGGAQYVRGIVPGNGAPPDSAMWLVYSSNKEDIFVARVPVPIRGTVEKDVNDDFEDMAVGGVVTDWNIYSGIWTPIAVFKDKLNNVLRLQDKDPYDYAKAVRVFPETKNARISFRLRPQQIGHGDLEIEVLNYKGQRPVRIKVEGASGKIKANDGVKTNDIASLSAGKWLDFDIRVATEQSKYDLRLNGAKVVSGASFAESLDQTGNPYMSRFNVPTMERLEFRTGAYRLKDFSRYGEGGSKYLTDKPDLAGADEAVEVAVFDLDDVQISSTKQ